MKTITCQNWQGNDVQKTELEFVEIWSGELNNLKNLTYTTKWQARVSAMKAEVRNEARREFRRVWAVQNR